MLPSLLQEIYKAFKVVIGTLWRNRQSVLNVVVVVIAVVVLGQLWYSSEQKQLVMLVGSRGSSSATIGPKIVEHISKTRNPNGVPYNIVLEPTLENIGIRERMTLESNRIALGIIADGQETDATLEDAGKPRVLLPMEWDYLFVLCSRKLFERVEKETGMPPLTLADVVDEVADGKLFLGAESSTSHRLAKLALDKFDISMIELRAKGIADWREMRTAFKNGELDLAFFSGPLGSRLIEEVAGDKTAVLLGLGNITEAIQSETGFQVYSARLPENLAIANTSLKKTDAPGLNFLAFSFLDVIANTGLSKVISNIGLNETEASAQVAFSRANLGTLASRRVLACPRSLSTADAYLLASAARAALIEDGYHINLNADDLPLGSDQKTANPLRMPLHPGLELLRGRQAPVVGRDWTTWPGWLQAAISILLGLLAIDALRLLGGRLEMKSNAEKSQPSVPTSSPQPPPSTTDEFDHFSIKLKGYEAQVDEQEHHETARQMGKWDLKLRELKKSIKESKQLTEVQREQLLVGIRLLSYDIVSSPQWAKDEAKRKKEKPATEASQTVTSDEKTHSRDSQQTEQVAGSAEAGTNVN